MEEQFEVVLVVAGDDLYKLNIVCDNLVKNSNPSKISIITNDIEKAKEIIGGQQEIKIIDEKTILKPFNNEQQSKYSIAGFPKRYFWYYQQFLKMAYSYYCESQYYLIWDADTVLTKSIDFFKEGIPIYTQGKEPLHPEYKSTFNNLFSQPYLSKNSFIAQHMIIDKDIMQEIINKLGGINSFQDTIIDSLCGKTQSQFSEYETYFNYILALNKPHLILKRNWFRYGAALVGFNPKDKDISKLSKHYDYVAFEKFDVGFLKKIRAKLVHFLSIWNR
ncbi:DUF6492 family protein [Providencia alcalifaciens]|uniref:DUF6492 family protein n=1 Tax=Providencia alcalifaciens TaxID=126385 RepID=UPI001CC5C8F8|nr:DUF6492 family protein [Providencia alcalifaciens]CAG9432966.1 hypothetical protein NVI2019_GHJFPKLH_03537 [Providencia alcalifaciens]